MIVCLFGQRFRPNADLDEDARLGNMLLEELRDLPGFISYHEYTAEDGELLGVIRFETKAALEAWRDNRAHRSTWPRAPSFYEYFWIQNCETYREYVWTAQGRTGEDMLERFRSEPANLGAPAIR